MVSLTGSGHFLYLRRNNSFTMTKEHKRRGQSNGVGSESRSFYCTMGVNNCDASTPPAWYLTVDDAHKMRERDALDAKKFLKVFGPRQAIDRKNDETLFFPPFSTDRDSQLHKNSPTDE